MHKKQIRFVALFGITAILLAACSSGGGATAAPASAVASAPASAGEASAPASAAGDPKTATSAADVGGVDAICAAGKAEGQVNIIATPPDWANYGQIITDFSAKYGIKVQSDKPDGNGQDEINAATQLAGTGRQPDIFDIGVVSRRRPHRPVHPVQGGHLGGHP